MNKESEHHGPKQPWLTMFRAPANCQERHGPDPRKEEPGRNWAEEPGPPPPGQRFGTGLLSFKNESEPENPLNRNSGSMVWGGGQ